VTDARNSENALLEDESFDSIVLGEIIDHRSIDRSIDGSSSFSTLRRRRLRPRGRFEFRIAFTATFYGVVSLARITRATTGEMIDDRQLSPKRSPRGTHLPNRGHGRRRSFQRIQRRPFLLERATRPAFLAERV